MSRELSIIVIIKNRTNINVNNRGKNINLKLFHNNLHALFKCKQSNEKWELVVVDFKSDDVNMQEYLQEAFEKNNDPTFTYKLVTMEDEFFNKGKGLNESHKHASYELMLYLDADMLLDGRKIIDVAYERCIPENKAFFPICMTYRNPEHTISAPRETGTGNVFISKSLLSKVRWPEYEQWGYEDEHFYQNLNKVGMTFRMNTKDFFHQWHPNDSNFKNRYHKAKGTYPRRSRVPNLFIAKKE